MTLHRCQARLAGTFYAAAHTRATCQAHLRLSPRRWHLRPRFASSGRPGEESGTAGAGRAPGVGAALEAPPPPGGPGGPEAEQDGEGEIPPEVSELFDILRGEALRRLEEFGPIHLFSLCWAYSTARLLDAELQRSVRAAALRLGEARDREPPRPRPEAQAGPAQAGPAQAGPAQAGPAQAEPAQAEPAQAEPAQAEPARAEPAGLPQGEGGGGAPTPGEAPPGPAAEGPEQPAVLAEGRHWMAFYKPPFWQVNVDSKEAAKAATMAPFEDDEDADDDAASEESRRRPRVHAWIRQHYASQYAICTDPVEAFGLLHRLDTQTSGLLLCAKTYVGAYWLRLQWCSYLVDKEYVCLVHGWVDRNVREIHKRIRIDKKKAPNSRRTISTHCTVGANGKPSFTEVCTLAHLIRPAAVSGALDEPYSLVVLKLHTGRTHQIRVHMLSIGHPLVCDAKYADDRFAADRLWCPRNFLHTYHLGFGDVPHGQASVGDPDGAGGPGDPGDPGGGPVKLRCPLPADLRAPLATLQPADDASAGRAAAWLNPDGVGLGSFADYAAGASGAPGAPGAPAGAGDAGAA